MISPFWGECIGARLGGHSSVEGGVHGDDMSYVGQAAAKLRHGGERRWHVKGRQIG